LQLHKNKNYQLQLHESVQFITFNDVIVIDLSLIKDCLHFVNTQVCLRLWYGGISCLPTCVS